MELSKECKTARLLGSDSDEAINSYIKGQNRDFYYKYFDGRLFDIIEPKVRNVNPLLADELVKSIKDEKISKRFKDCSATMKSFDGFLEKEVPSFTWNENFKLAVEMVTGLLPNAHLKPLTIHRDMDISVNFSNLNASSGVISPRQTKRRQAKRIISIAKMMESEINSPTCGVDTWLPSLSFHRSQISRYVVDGKVNSDNIKYKDRLVWCIDAATVLIESKYARPIINATSGVFKQYAGGLSHYDIRRYINANCRGKSWVSLDFSSFDQTIPSWLIRSAFEILWQKYFPQGNWNEKNWICDRFINTYLITLDGRLVQKHKGIPSGSYFTQMIGSLCNMLMILTYLFSTVPSRIKKRDKMEYVQRVLSPTNNINSPSITMLTMGDDNIVFTYGDLDLHELSSYLKRNFGTVVNPDKCETSRTHKNPVFLKREWQYDGEYRDALELLVNMLHSEREREYKDGSTPWHVLLGYYLTYKNTMKAFLNINEIYDAIESSLLGFESFNSLHVNDLPGSLRVLLMDDRLHLASRMKYLANVERAA